MEAYLCPETGLTIPCFRGDLDFTAFPNGAEITIDPVICPWVGSAFQLSIDADPYPSPNLTTLRVLNDRTGAFGTAYAYVDATLGTAGGVASATPATAATSPFQTALQAVTAIRAFNNANYGRNYTDGGVIRLVEGVTPLAAAIRTAGVTNKWPLTIEAADSAKRDTTIFTDGGASVSSSIPDRVIVKDVTIQRSTAGSVTFLDQAAASLAYTSFLLFKNCKFVDAVAPAAITANFVNRCSRVRFDNCIGDLSMAMNSNPSSQNKTVTALGCSNLYANAVYLALGCISVGAALGGAAATSTARVPAVGMFFGWNALRVDGSNTTGAIRNDLAIGSRGLAVIGNTLEGYGSFSNALLWLNGDGNTAPVQNVVVQLNTTAGQRANLLYLDEGTEAVKSGYFRFNAFESFNIKGDYHSKVGVVGNWPVRFKVGWFYNSSRFGSADGNGYSTQSWLGEFASAGEVTGTMAAWLVMNFADDRSNAAGGTGTGGGDYTPGPGNVLPFIPAGMAPYPVDQKGRPISNEGAARIGALQMAA